MTSTVQKVLDEVSKILKDEWSFEFDQATELLPLLNRAVPEIVWRDPMASPVIAPLLCADGRTQTIPADAVALIDVRCNLGATNVGSGNIITKVPRDHMDAARPSWPTDVMGSPGVPAAPRHYTTDERLPRFFDLWPQPNGTWWVEIRFSFVPDDVAAGDNFPLPDMYIASCEHWMIANALAGRRPQLDAQGQFLVAYHTQEFEKSMGATVAGTVATVPSNTVNRQ